ncbi:CPBP family intramembrane glutamic endopeptidase [Mycobacterium sp.]|uniref:CPBP family intramembrane glutamic endopeptidase n=1 Tax=Mycobacterium sp. TaxID=1785 RepID=UPI002DA31B23|nr:type II CAAX endopeptidase family protein [Mycobacterium sp.]
METVQGRANRAPVKRTHRWGLGAFVLVEVVYVLASVALVVFFGGDSSLPIGLIAMVVTLPAILAAGLAMFITKLRGNGPRTDLRMHWTWRGLGIGLLFGIGGLFVTLPASMLYISIVGPDASSAAAEVFGSIRASWLWAVVVLLIVVLVVPACEEIIYRGLLWGALDWRWGRWVTLAITTVVFALAHLEFTRTPLLLVVALPIALARLYSDSLLASIVAHQVNNLLPGIVVMLSLVGMMPVA